MALGAAALIIGSVALIAASGGKKKRRKKVTNGTKQLPSEPPTPPEEEPSIQWEMTPSSEPGGQPLVEWWMPEGWLEEYATPRLQEYVIPRHEAGEEIDALDVTLYLLQGQTTGFPLPPAPHPPEGEMWQADVPNAANYYDGPDSVLGLFYHVAEYVEDGLGRWQAGDDLYLADLGFPEDEG